MPVSIRHLEKYILKQTAPHELDKVLSTKFYAEVTKRNRDTNELEYLKVMQSAIQRYLKEKTIHSRASCSRGSFTTQKEIHRRITPAAPSSSFSKDNEKSQRQPQKKGRSSIIDSGEEIRTLMHERPMKETVFVLTSELLVCCYASMSFRHMTSFCILNKSISGSALSNKPARLGTILHQNIKFKAIKQ